MSYTQDKIITKKVTHHGVVKKRTNHILYEHVDGTEKYRIKGKKLPEPSPKKEQREILDNYKYIETKQIKNEERKRASIVKHERLSNPVGKETPYLRGEYYNTNTSYVQKRPRLTTTNIVKKSYKQTQSNYSQNTSGSEQGRNKYDSGLSKYRNKNDYLYLFDNEIIKFPYNPHLTIFMFQNYLKLFSFYVLDKFRIYLLFNLTIRNIYDLREEFKENDNEKKDENKKNIEDDDDEYIRNYYNFKNYRNYDFHIFGNINNKKIKNIYLVNLHLMSGNLIYLCFKNIYINELLIKVACFDDEKKLGTLNYTYINLIKKSNICYIQEPLIISKYIIDNLSINDLYLQYNILIYFLDFYTKSKALKKSEPSLLSFKFSTFKCHINREHKNIQLFFDFSKIKEKTLYEYLKKTQEIIKLEKTYEGVLCLLRDFKNYESKVRLTQSNFRTHQLNYLFSIIIKKLVDFIDEMKMTRVNILESKFNNFNPNMKVYIKNSRLRKKTRIEQIRKMIQCFPFYNKIRALVYYLNQLEENFDLIMLSDNYNKDFRLIRKCDENKIYFFICKENKKVNILEKEKQKEDNKFASTGVETQPGRKKDKKGQKSLDEYNEYLNIVFYIKSDQISFINIMNLLDTLIDDPNFEIQNNVTMICDRFYLESYIIMEQSLKSTTKKLFAVVDNFFLIAKKEKRNSNNDEKESFNYDVFISDDYISVANYHQFKYETKNNYYDLVFEFLSCLSSCIELIIYSLRTKDIYLEKFFYILRTINNKYFSFEYKNTNIFFKKIKDFDTLLFFNPKKTEPLLCLLPKIPESDYTMSVNNFYDVNLNKVEQEKEKLREVFLYKIHKNIFYENYDSIILISYSYQAFNIFNNFFMNINYISTKKEKFNNIFFFPFNRIPKDKNYSDLIKCHINLFENL